MKIEDKEMEESKNTRYQQAEHVIGSSIDEAMIITSTNDDKFYGMNKIASVIWNLLESPISKEEVVSALLAQFKVEQQQCEQEVNFFFEEMKHAAIIDKVA